MADAAISVLFDKPQGSPAKSFICSACGEVTLKRKPNGPQKFCDSCRDATKSERGRRASRKHSYLKRGSIPAGTNVSCEWCRADFASRQGGNRFCSEDCRHEQWLAQRWRKRLTSAVRKPGQIVLCEWCEYTYEYGANSDKSRCPECVASGAEPSLRELWSVYRKRKTEDGVSERKRKYFRHYHDRRREDPRHVLDERMSVAVRRSLINGKEGLSWKEMVSYTVDELKESLERQFLPGMSWGNYGEWHIDHRVPISAHNYDSPKDADFKACWAITNLQPLWAEDNIRKGARLLYLV